MTIPESPDGYEPYEKYSLPWWALIVTFVFLSGVYGMLLWYIDPRFYPVTLLNALVGAFFGFTGTVFIHESLHYLTATAFGYDAVYNWPNKTIFPDQDINRTEAVVISIAPQLLSVVYALLLNSGLESGLQILVAIGLLLNLVGGLTDVPMAIRRATWPSEVELLSGDSGELYVAFPKDDS